MIRKAIIILLSLATFATGGMWVLSCIELQWELHGTRFGIHIRHSPYPLHGYWIIYGGDWNQSRMQIELKDGRIALKFFDSKMIPGRANYTWKLGKLYVEKQTWRGKNVMTIGTPPWLPFVLFATYPTITFIRGPLRRYRRRKRGWCIHCSYDLMGNVTGVCSECGQAI